MHRNLLQKRTTCSIAETVQDMIWVDRRNYKDQRIADCGEAVPALRPAGILPALGNKGKMPSPRRKSQIDGVYDFGKGQRTMSPASAVPHLRGLPCSIATSPLSSLKFGPRLYRMKLSSVFL